MKVLISAAETSSDAHGAQLLRALKAELAERTGESVEAFGIGGPQLRAEGLRTIVDARKLLSMGFQEILGRLPQILRALRLLTEVAARERPQFAVVIDYPDFHFRLARRLKKLGIPVIYYIPPKVWAWRKGRIQVLREEFARILSIFPFEETFYRKEGVPVTYVGNPLVDELPLGLGKAVARQKLGVADQEAVLLIMPGSRPAELGIHTEMMLNGALLTAQKLREKAFLKDSQKLRVLLPVPVTVSLEGIQKKVEQWTSLLAEKDRGWMDLRVSQGDAHLCMVAADVGVIKSGTSTLEAGLLGCPHAVVYKTARLSTWIFRFLIRYSGPVGLVNLVAGGLGQRKEDFLLREILLDDATPEALAQESVSFWSDSEKMERVRRRLAELRAVVLGADRKNGQYLSPSLKAARELLDFASQTVQGPPVTNSLFQRMAFLGLSGLWSTVSSFARFLVRKGWLASIVLDSRVISVGNIQAGGTGKTPLVARIAREAGERGLSVAILCRGYRGAWERGGGVIPPGISSEVLDARHCGDEAALLHDLVPAAWVGVGADRVRSYHQIRKKMGGCPDLVLLDDGFQNWKIRKDLEVVAVTSRTRKEAFFRERQTALKSADLLVWTKGHRPPSFEGRPWVRTSFRIGPAPKGSKSLLLVTGVGDSSAVRESVLGAGFVVADHLSFRDHAEFDPQKCRELFERAKREGLQLSMTGKDWVKWRSFGISRAEVLVLEPDLVFLEGQSTWERFLWG